MLVLRRLAAATTTAAVTLGCAAAVAQANDAGVKATIKTQDHALGETSQYKKLAGGTLKTSQLPQAIKLCRGFEVKLLHAADVVSRTRGSTPTGKAGKKDWVAAVRATALGYAELATSLKDIEHGQKAAGKAKAEAALRTFHTALALDLKADHLLKLPLGA
jgi:hypothetical protein